MDEYKLFTWHPINYPIEEVKKFTKELSENHQKYTVM